MENDQPSAAESPPFRPGQFSLRTLLVVMTLWAGVCPFLKYLGLDVLTWLLIVVLVYAALIVAVVLVRAAVSGAGERDPLSPRVLVSVRSEAEAAMLVDRLRQSGVRAMAVGGYSAGFRAEAPGLVKVVVPRDDYHRAKTVLQSSCSEADLSPGPD
jgi:hypothetical protein